MHHGGTRYAIPAAHNAQVRGCGAGGFGNLALMSGAALQQLVCVGGALKVPMAADSHRSQRSARLSELPCAPQRLPTVRLAEARPSARCVAASSRLVARTASHCCG